MKSAPILEAPPVARETLPRWFAPARNAIALLLVVFFLAVLAGPLIRADFRATQQMAAHENRKLKPFPRWSWKLSELKAFPAQFEEAFNDHFGFRDALVLWHHQAVFRWLKTSPVEGIMVGRGEWLFYKDSVREHCRIRTISKSEARWWAEYLSAKQAWLAARNVKYLLVVAPNKEDIYPEYLPTPMRRNGNRYLDRILARVGTEVDLLDLRQTMLEAKPLGLVYDRTDTHWSQLGAFVAVNQIVKHLQPSFPGLAPSELSARQLTRQTGPGGDLAHLLGFPAAIPEDRLVVPFNTKLYQPAQQRFDPQWNSLFTSTLIFERAAQGRLPSVFLSGDSFGNLLMMYLPEFFQRTVRVRPQFPYSAPYQAALPRLVAEEKPDIYIDILCERHLRLLPAAFAPGQ